ncbi:MAG: carotenoid oxygenase family protein [Geobacter sp.]|nr:carotenoid oxygenase family protein [Geobacter sp.]
MLTRRDFLRLTGGAGMALALPGCAMSPPLRRENFHDFGDEDHPYLGLATSLPEEHDYEAQVDGRLPTELRGTFYRIGPGLFDRGGLRKRTLLDGDGMVQSFTFHDSGVRFRNRFVRTKRYVDEEAAGRFIYPSWCTQAPGGFWANFFKADDVSSQAGITVYWRNGKLFAFDEGSFPYELDPETLDTVGQTTFGLPPELTMYAAHSRMDPLNGEWLHFGVRFGPKPTLHVTIFGPDGKLRNHRSIPYPRYVYMHDWFVSDRHVIINLQPVVIHFWGFLFGFRSMIESLRWEPEQGNLLIVMEREGNNPPVLIETPPFFMWHSINAFEEKGEIVADFIGYDSPDYLVGKNSVVSAVVTGRKPEIRSPGIVRRWRIDPVSKRIRQETIAGGSCEWPRVNELFRCHPYRVAYMIKCRGDEFYWSILTRVDMATGNTVDYDFGSGRYCTEPVFIPLPGHIYRADDPMEKGWLVTEVYDSSTRKSHLAILRAENIAAGPVARIQLTHHVPFSFHGWWHGRG